MTNQTYKAAIFRGPGKVEIVDLPYPTCGDDDVIVKNIITGICGSDIYAYQNGGDSHLIWKDHEFGHEVVSQVVEMGTNVCNLEIGDLVFPNQGKALRDWKRSSTVGGFSQFIKIPLCEVGYSVLKLGNDLPKELGVLFEPLAVGARAAWNYRDVGKKAVVFGAGIIGTAIAVMLEWYGYEKVLLSDVSEYRLEKARGLGFSTCNPSKEELKACLAREFGTQVGPLGETPDVHLFVDAIGKPVSIDTFMELAGIGATLGIVGVHHEPVPMKLDTLCYYDWRIMGTGTSTSEERQDDILAMIRSGRYDLSSLVTHAFPLDEIDTALVLARSVDSVQKVCISFA